MKGNIKALIQHDWNVICDVCGRKRKRSEVTNAYGTGIIPVVVSCLDGCADSEHPLNFPPPIIFDGRPVPDARPDISVANTIYEYVPSGMTWGHFPNLGVWSAFNGLNNEFSTNPIITWGNF